MPGIESASDWDEIKNFITKTMLEGTNSTYKGELSKILQINQEEVEVVYKVLGTGRLIISNAWVKT
jgi:Bacterial toxin 35